MLTLLAVVVVVLLVVGVAYDLRARRRGTYRSSSEWVAMSRRRRSHFRRDRAGDVRPEER